jgi:2-polyprenyl-6-methoxyphenol hydroxylase-like FAD-dependent oxidoreductase
MVVRICSWRRTLFSQLDLSRDSQTDIIVVGAGLAGSVAACVLGRRWSVTLVDPQPSCPPVFKAEKIEPDQAELLRKLGLMEILLPHAGRIREIASYYRGKFLGVTPTEQYGISYRVMVNALRAELPERTQFRLGRVTQIANSSDLQHVVLDGEEVLRCRLVVLACGLNADLIGSLQLKRVLVQKRQCIGVAFTLGRPNGQPFSFDSLTYSMASPTTGIDYVSFFPMGPTMRANLFSFPAADSSWLQKFIREPNLELPKILPKVERALGEFQVVGRVETSVTDLYRTEREPPAGVVLIGDASQNSCPSTGKGLTKIFTDVDVLGSCVPRWFESAGMGKEKLESYASDPRKTGVDAQALRNAQYRRNACAARSLKWRIHRSRLHLAREFGKA